MKINIPARVNINSPLAEKSAIGMLPKPICANISSNIKVLYEKKSINIPARKPRSPIRLVINAFLPASAAESFSYQKPISKYELKPTSSQNTYIKSMLFASTMPSIEKVKMPR